MTLQYDSSGKIFTKVVRKETMRARMQTLTHQVVGNIYVEINSRLKEELDKESMIAVTDAEVYDAKGNQIASDVGLIIVNRDHLVWVMPEEEEPRDRNVS